MLKNIENDEKFQKKIFPGDCGIREVGRILLVRRTFTRGWSCASPHKTIQSPFLFSIGGFITIYACESNRISAPHWYCIV